MRLDPAGIPFVAGAVLLAALVAWLATPVWATPLFVLAAFFLFFFRDPERRLPDAAVAAVVSPADGRVLIAGDAEPQSAPPGRWRQVSIFLSPIDVHVNRVPMSGAVTRIEHHPGRFLPAFREEAATANERSEVWIENDGRVMVFRQVVGVLARRVVCRLRPGQRVRAGERFGIMKFGSRMDVFVPLSATLRVQVGDHVRGGETILATFGLIE